MKDIIDKNFQDGVLLNRYRFVSYLQKGSYGRVMKCIDLTTNSHVSVKAIPIRYEDIATHEIDMLKQLTGNLNICQLITSYTLNNYIYLVLEYCNGGDLYDYIRDHKGVNSSDLYLIASQLYNAITFAHKKGIYHRDLKPENILIHDTSRSNDFRRVTFKICDWGLSTTTRLNEEFNVGTEKYMAPEVFINNYNANLNLKFYDAKYVDYWSCGITLITLLFGRTPFKVIDKSNKSLINDTNYKKFVLFNEKQILFDIYPNLNLNGFNIFDNLLKINGIDDNLTNFMNKINQRSLDKFIHDLGHNYKFGLTIDDELELDLGSGYNTPERGTPEYSSEKYSPERKRVTSEKPTSKIGYNKLGKLKPKLDYALKLDKDIKIIESEILVDDFTNLNWFDY